MCVENSENAKFLKKVLLTVKHARFTSCESLSTESSPSRNEIRQDRNKGWKHTLATGCASTFPGGRERTMKKLHGVFLTWEKDLPSLSFQTFPRRA